MLAYGLDTKTEGEGVSVCPGPNMAYFSKEMNLSEMINHIYGKANVITRTDRPNIFIKELGIYIKYVNDKLEESREGTTDKQRKYLTVFLNNLKEGVLYYQTLFTTSGKVFKENKDQIINDLQKSLGILGVLEIEVKSL